MSFVSITAAGTLGVRLRRYEVQGARLICTHDGAYDPQGVTLANVGYYHDNGAPQDLLRRPRHRGASCARGGPPPTAA